GAVSRLRGGTVMRYNWVGIGAVVLAIAWMGRAGAERKPGKKAADEAVLRQGEYLVNEVAHCGHCHTPQNDKGQPDGARALQGATLHIRPKKETKDWADMSPDITRSGLAGEWGEEKMIKFLMTGVDPDGQKPMPPMPVFHLKKEDARAVA